MRRFSQRSALVTLSEINITPLLDLAFVLLIIFVITTPLLEKGLDLHLPTLANGADREIHKDDIMTVQITRQGGYVLQGRPMPLPQVLASLAQIHKLKPNMVVDVRADKDGRMESFTDLVDGCQKINATQMSVRGVPLPSPMSR
jgi:biopolymer transport protein ExbD